MNMNEKIQQLRRQQGWSQEDLAGRMDVSRQAVAKWESGQAMPSIEKILQLSQLFSVSTDYLLRDDLSSSEPQFFTVPQPECQIPDAPSAPEMPLRSLSLAEAEAYLQQRQLAARKISAGVVLCILSPALLIILCSAASFGLLALSETAAAGIGLMVLLLMAAAAVGLFLKNDHQSSPCAFLESDDFVLDGPAFKMVQMQQAQFEPVRRKQIIAGILLCILSCLPVFAALITGSPVWISFSVAGLLLTAAVGVYLLIHACTIGYSFERLLQENEFSPKEKQLYRRLQPVSSCYWLIVTAVYLIWSFSTQNWKTTWILWMAAGILYGALITILKSQLAKSGSSGK